MNLNFAEKNQTNGAVTSTKQKCSSFGKRSTEKQRKTTTCIKRSGRKRPQRTPEPPKSNLRTHHNIRNSKNQQKTAADDVKRPKNVNKSQFQRENFNKWGSNIHETEMQFIRQRSTQIGTKPIAWHQTRNKRKESEIAVLKTHQKSYQEEKPQNRREKPQTGRPKTLSTANNSRSLSPSLPLTDVPFKIKKPNGTDTYDLVSTATCTARSECTLLFH